jgi:hypothetical protein
VGRRKSSCGCVVGGGGWWLEVRFVWCLEQFQVTNYSYGVQSVVRTCTCTGLPVLRYFVLLWWLVFMVVPCASCSRFSSFQPVSEKSGEADCRLHSSSYRYVRTRILTCIRINCIHHAFTVRPHHHDRIPHNSPQSHSFPFSNRHRKPARSFI